MGQGGDWRRRRHRRQWFGCGGGRRSTWINFNAACEELITRNGTNGHHSEPLIDVCLAYLPPRLLLLLLLLVLFSEYKQQRTTPWI